LGGSRIPTEVRLLRVRPVWKTLVPQPEPFRPWLVDVLGPGESRQPKMLHRRTPPARMVVLIAGALERRRHLLRARARVTSNVMRRAQSSSNSYRTFTAGTAAFTAAIIGGIPVRTNTDACAGCQLKLAAKFSPSRPN